MTRQHAGEALHDQRVVVRDHDGGGTHGDAAVKNADVCAGNARVKLLPYTCRKIAMHWKACALAGSPILAVCQAPKASAWGGIRAV